jgi:hypothetical protein
MAASANSSHDEAIVDPSLRPLEPGIISPIRRRLAFVLFALGFAVLIVGTFVAFGQWLLIAGSILIIVSLFLFGRFRRVSEKPDEIRKLYGQREI